jgi:hypothetical protein
MYPMVHFPNSNDVMKLHLVYHPFYTQREREREREKKKLGYGSQVLQVQVTCLYLGKVGVFHNIRLITFM